MTYIQRGRYHHDTDQWDRDGLRSQQAQDEVHAHALTALAIFESIVPRDDNTWAESVSVSSGVRDRGGLRACASLRSSDPNAAAKEFGHLTFLGKRLKSGRKSRKQGRRVFVEGSHSMTKAMAAATGGGGQVRTRGRR